MLGNIIASSAVQHTSDFAKIKKKKKMFMKEICIHYKTFLNFVLRK